LLCGFTVTSEVYSPDGTLAAATVNRGCGGGAGSFNVQVEIRRKENSYPFDKTSAVLVLGCPGIPKLKWLHNHLSIGLTRALAECVVRKEYEWNGIPISYDDLARR
jgi:hypothetical protein